MVGKAVPGGFRMQTEGGERTPGVAGVSDVRERVLSTAAELFYREGVRAVGVDLIVQRAGVAKTSLYRHFRTKDDLVEAFLKREDAEFWEHWDEVARRHAGDPAAELDAHLDWIAERIRSEEHPSELQSLMRISYAVFCLTKKNNIHTTTTSLQYN